MSTLPTGKIFIIDKDHNLIRLNPIGPDEEKELLLEYPEEEITNGGFESGVLDPWQYTGDAEATNIDAHTGSYCGRVYSLSGSLIQVGFDVEVNFIFAFEVWYKGHNVVLGKMDIYIEYTDESATTIHDVQSTEAWQKFNLKAVLDPNKTVHLVSFILTGGADILIDDLTLTSSNFEMTILTGDSNWLYIAGGGTNKNIIMKVDGSGDMVINSIHTLANGRKIRGIAQSGDYIYVTCLEDGDGELIPRVIKLTKSDLTEVDVNQLDTISGDSADNIGPIVVDGTNLIIGGSVASANAALWVIDIADFSAFTASYKYAIFQDNRAYEDLKGFTEIDPGTRIDVIHHNYLDFVANTSEDARLVKDYGFNYFADFTHSFKFCIDSSEEGAIAYPYLLAKDTLDAKGLHDESITFIGLRFIQDGASSYKLYLHEDYGGVAYESDALTIIPSTFYFCAITKGSIYLICDIYSTQALLDEGGTGDLGQKTLTLQANHMFQYLHAGDTYNDGSNKTCDVDIENLLIYEVDSPGQIETFYADTTYIYALTTNGMCFKITKADLTLNASNYIIPTGPSHIPKMECYFYPGTEPWNDLFWVTGCTFKHLLKMRTGVWGLEQELADEDFDWTSFGCAIGWGDYLFIGAANCNQLKQVELYDISIVFTIYLGMGGTHGINAMWGN